MQALLTTWPGGWCGAVEFVAILIAHLSAEAHPRALALRVVITHKISRRPAIFTYYAPQSLLLTKEAEMNAMLRL
jgi:hypothetical protein